MLFDNNIESHLEIELSGCIQVVALANYAVGKLLRACGECLGMDMR